MMAFNLELLVIAGALAPDASPNHNALFYAIPPCRTLSSDALLLMPSLDTYQAAPTP